MTFAWGSVRPPAAIASVDDEGGSTRRLELLPSGPPTVRRSGCYSVVTPEGFHALEPIWRELCASARAPTPFHSWDFAVEWLDQFVTARAGSATGRFKVIVASDARAGVIGLTPLFEEHLLGEARL